MKKGITILIGFWVVLGLIILGLIISGVFMFGVDTVSNFDTIETRYERNGDDLMLDETLSMDGIDGIDLSFGASEVNIYHADDDSFRINQYGENLDEGRIVTVSKDGSSIKAKSPSVNINIFNWSINGTSYIDVYIPGGYSDDLKISLSAGNLTVSDSFDVSDLNVGISAGKLEINDMTAQKSKITSSAGGIYISELISDDFNISSSAGKINIGNLYGSGKITSSAGEIRIDSMDIADSLALSSSAGSIHVGLVGDPSLDFTAKTSGGSINTYFAGKVSSSSGKLTQKVGDGPYKKMEISSSAGSVNITKAD